MAALSEPCAPAPEGGPTPSRLGYLGPVSAKFRHPLPLAAQLSDGNGLPLADRSLLFTLGAQTVSAATDASGIARATISPSGTPGATPLGVQFAGDAQHLAASVALEISIERADTVTRYEGTALLAAGGTQTVIARLVDPDDGAPVAGRRLDFTIGSVTASAITDGSGRASAALDPGVATGSSQLAVAFAGDAWYRPSSTTTPILLYQPSRFVVWGGNSGGLAVGQRVNFWGSQWWKQVTGGDYRADGSFKGFAPTVTASAICQPRATTTSNPPLAAGCWSAGGGNSTAPPATVPEYIGVLVATSIAKSDSTIFGNIASLAVVKVDAVPAYGPNPGHPGFGTLVGTISDEGSVFPRPVLLEASQTQPAAVLPGQPFAVSTTLSNPSTTGATQVTVTGQHQGAAPSSTSTAVGALAAGSSVTVEASLSTDAVAPRAPEESSPSYEYRLAIADGRLLSSRSTIAFSDAAGALYAPLTVSSTSLLSLPRLGVAIVGSPCAGPGGTVAYTVFTSNLGSAAAVSGRVLVTLPDGSTREIELSPLQPGARSSSLIEWQVPPPPTIMEGESMASYLARLAAYDNAPRFARAAVTWSDAAQNPYGPVEDSYRSLERLPRVAAVAPLLPPLLPSQTIDARFELVNEGSGDAFGVSFALASPGGATASAAPLDLAAQARAEVVVGATAPSVTPRQSSETDAAYASRLAIADGSAVELPWSLRWQDAAANHYGPAGGVARTALVLPVVQLSVAAPSAAAAGDTVEYVVTLVNQGGADATSLTLSVAGPELPPNGMALPPLPAGRSAVISLPITIPPTAPAGSWASTVMVTWEDAADFDYGPLAAPVTLTLERPNQPPLVNAGLDQTATVGAPLALVGSVTDDGQPAGVAITTNWSQLSGPAEVAFADPFAISTVANFTTPGVYVLLLEATDSRLSASDTVTITVNPAISASLALMPSSAGPNVVGTQQILRAHLADDAGTPLIGVPIQLVVTGANPTGANSTTDAAGNAAFSYTGNASGSDTVHATAIVSGATFTSNPATVSWVTPAAPVSTSSVYCRFFEGSSGGVFTIPPTRPVAFAQTFPTINFNPPPGAVPGQPSTIDVNTRPFINVTTDVNGNYTGAIFAEGNGYQAGLNTMFEFSMVCTGNFTVAEATEVTFRFWSDDGFIFGMGGGAQRVSGPSLNVPPDGLTPFEKYPVMGSYNIPTGAVGNFVTIRFPGPGTYPFEVDYTECCGFGLVLTVTTTSGNIGLPSTGTLTLSPAAFVSRPAGLPQTYTALAVDASGSPIANQQIVLNVTGANARWYAAFTDGTGRATFTHAGLNTGVDALQAATSLGGMATVSNLVAIQWLTNSNSAPLVSAGPDQTVTQPTSTVTLTGTASDDGRIAPLTLQWTQVSGPVAAIASPASATTSVTLPAIGTYVFRLTANDGELSSSDEVMIRLYALDQPPNEGPSVSVTASPTVTLPSALLLAGTVSDDGLPAGGVLTTLWTQVSGPAPALFTSPNAPSTSVLLTQAGNYTLRLTANDSQLSASVDVAITVKTGAPANQPPSVSAGPDASVALGSPLALSGLVADDGLPANGALTVAWSKLSGPGNVSFENAGAPVTSASFDAAGSYVLALTANDSQLSASDTVAVTVAAPPLSNPTLVLSPSSAGPNSVATGQTLSAQLFAEAGAALGGIPIQFTVSGANSRSESVLTDGAGLATFHYQGNASGSDTVRAVATVGTSMVASNEATVRWVTPAANVTVSGIVGRFFPGVGRDGFGNCSIFQVPPSATPAFTQPFSSISFNPTSTRGPLSQESGISELTKHFTHVAVDTSGAFAGITPAEGDGFQAGLGALAEFSAVFTGTLTVAAAGTVIIHLIQADAESTILGIGGGATRVGGGPLVNLPADGLTPFERLPVVASGNDGANPGASVSVNFPAPGTYPFELDYASACDFSGFGPFRSLTMLTSTVFGGPTRPRESLTLTPFSSPSQPAGFKQGLTARLLDASGAPVPGATVFISSYPGGANAQSFRVVTDADGRASATIAGLEPGSDRVIAETYLAGEEVYSNTVLLTWLPNDNRPPQVSAGANQAIVRPAQTATLAGSASDDGALTLAWSQVSGPAPVVFAAPGSAITDVTLPALGRYVLRLTVNDGQLESSSEVTITSLPPDQPPNQPPQVSVTADRTIRVPNGVILLAASVSDDGNPIGGTLTTRWSQVSGPARTLLNPDVLQTTVRMNTTGRYVFRFVADDGMAATSADVTIDVAFNGDLSLVPFVSAGPDQTIPFGSTATLSGFVNDSTLQSLFSLATAWSKVSGPGSVSFSDPLSAVTRASFSAAGTYVLRLHANESGRWSSDDVTITVASAPNQAPVVSAGPDRAITLPATASLAGSVSDDGQPSGSTLALAWSKLSGPGAVSFSPPDAAATQASFTLAGTYVLRLTASDSLLSSSDEVAVSVELPPVNLPPHIELVSQMTASMPGSALVQAQVSDDGRPQPALTIQWTQLSGPAAVQLGDAHAAATTVAFPQPGTYLLRISVSDGEASTSAEVMVSGRPGLGNTAPQIYSTPPASATTGQLYTYAVLAEDKNGDPLAFTLESAPAGMIVDGATGLVSWRPGASDEGEQQIRVRATDPAGAFDEQSFTLAVARGSAAPAITSTPPLAATPGALYQYAATARDPDDLALLWSVDGPSGMQVDASGTVRWMVPSGMSGSFAVTLAVADPAGHRAEQRFSIGVAPAEGNLAPRVSLLAPQNGATVTQPIDIVGSVSDEDLAGYEILLCRSWSQAPGCQLLQKGLLPNAGGVLGTLDPKSLADGSWQIRVVATDAGGNQSRAVADVLIKTGVRKLGVLRLQFEEFNLRTRTAEVALTRIYDGLDLSPGEIGNGWRYQWDIGHSERPQPLGEAWTVDLDTGSFIPRFVVNPSEAHPIKLVLEDGRVYEFELFLTHDGSFSSIHPVRPELFEIGATGARLALLDARFAPYSTQYFDLIVIGDTVFESDFATPWEPAYYQLTTDFGEVIVFNASTGQIAEFSDGSGFKLERSGAGVRLDGRDLVRFERGPDGKLTAAIDELSGARVEYRRDPEGNLVEARRADGTIETFTYEPGSRLSGYQVAGGGAERFEYDERGRVVLHVLPGGAILRTVYDDSARRVTLVDAAGNEMVTEYDLDGNVRKTISPLHHVTTYDYLPGTDKRIRLTDPLGHTWRWEYDPRNRPTVEIDPLQNRMEIVYDPTTGYPARAIDGELRSFVETLGPDGLVTARVLPDGTTARRFTYTDDTVTDTDARGHSLTTHYDDRGRVIATDDGSARTTTVYDDLAHTVRVTHADGTQSFSTLDAAGRTLRRETSVGTFQYHYAGSSLPDRVIRPDGVPMEISTAGGEISQIRVGGAVVERTSYDALGRVASTQSEGSVVSYRYDADGRRVQVSSSEGTLRYEYDAAGRITRITSDAGLDRTYVHDDAGRVIAFANGVGERYEFAYDKSNRLKSAVDRAGRSYQLGYDANGRLNGITLPGGISASWAYLPSDTDDDDAPPLASRTDIEGITWSYDYDRDEALTLVRDGSGGETRYTRVAGRVTNVRDALDRDSSFRYGDRGLEEWITPEGRHERHQYDEAGRLSSTTRADDSTVSFEYQGNLRRVRLPGGEVHETIEDPAAGMSIQRAPAGTVTEWRNASGRTEMLQLDDGARLAMRYVEEGRVGEITAVAPDGASFTTRYFYDANGRMERVVDPDGHTTQYDYDEEGRLIGVIRPNGTSTVISFGALERPTRIEHFSGNTPLSSYAYEYDTHGRVRVAETPEGRFEFEYDALSRLAVEKRLQNGALVEEKRRTYDAVGNLRTLVDAAGTTTFEYDRDDRLLSATGPSGATHYRYSGRGALTRIEAPGALTVFEYDAADRLRAVTLPDGREISYRYDAAGRLLQRTDENGTRRCLPLPSTPSHGEDCALLYSGNAAPRALVFGANGLASTHGGEARYALASLQAHLIGLTDGDGVEVGHFAYDAWGRRTSAAGEDPGYGFTAERQDPATGAVFLRARWYAPELGRFLTPDRWAFAVEDPRTLHRYAYALDNPLNRRDPSGHTTLLELNLTVAIQNAIQAFKTGFEVCVREKLKGQIFRAVARWAIGKVIGAVKSAVFAAVPGLGILEEMREIAFQNQLALMLCGKPGTNEKAMMPGGGNLIEFEVPVTPCGDNFAGTDSRRGPDVEAYYDCGAAGDMTTGFNGIDILFGRVVPLELKRTNATHKPAQLIRYCRFAANRGAHVTLYGYITLPDQQTNDAHAVECWGCWKPTHLVPNCDKPGSVGSVFFAFGAQANREGKKFYAPQPSLLSCK